MIYVVALSRSEALSWVERHGMDAEDVHIVTCDHDAQGRVLGSADQVIRLDPYRELDSSVFYLQVHLRAEQLQLGGQGSHRVPRMVNSGCRPNPHHGGSTMKLQLKLTRQQKEELAERMRYVAAHLRVERLDVVVPKTDQVSYVFKLKEDDTVRVERRQRGGYFVIEHPTRGILRDLEETDSGSIGRWGGESRGDGEVFVNLERAKRAMAQIRPASRAEQAQIRSSVWEGDNWVDPWPVVG